jgi:transcription initiation factor TFIIIB Brf1 subunit/transcription initiation factor TFIIB
MKELNIKVGKNKIGMAAARLYFVSLQMFEPSDFYVQESVNF